MRAEVSKMIWRRMTGGSRVKGPVAKETWCVGLALVLLGTGLVSDELQEMRIREQFDLLDALTSLRSAVLEAATAWPRATPNPAGAAWSR
jgi:hypothetical protein